MEQIEKAVSDLYGSWDQLPEASQAFIQSVFQDGRFEQLYSQMAADEKETRSLLIQFEQNYPDVLKQENADCVAQNLQKKTNRASLLASLREMQQEAGKDPGSGK